VYAGDIGDEVRGTESGSTNKNGGFLELGVSAVFDRESRMRGCTENADESHLNRGLSISAGYRYKRVFIEASESGFDGLNMGVTLFENDRWNVDLLLANIAGNITVESDEPPPPTTETERSLAILDRDSIFIAAGTRVTGYFGDNIVQLRLVSDWYGNNGILGSARVGRRWQRGNWNVQAIAGLRYNSAEINNYTYGISSAEQSERFAQYTAGDAWIPELELSASLPVKENWLYSTRLRYRHYPSSVTNSPIMENDSDVILSTGIHYVF
jgi:outer membrane protein